MKRVPDGCFGKLCLIGDANNFDKSRKSMYFKHHFASKFKQIVSKRPTSFEK